MDDQPLKRSNTIERLAILLAEKRERKQKLKEQQELRRLDSDRRKQTHQDLIHAASSSTLPESIGGHTITTADSVDLPEDRNFLPIDRQGTREDDVLEVDLVFSPKQPPTPPIQLPPPQQLQQKRPQPPPQPQPHVQLQSSSSPPPPPAPPVAPSVPSTPQNFYQRATQSPSPLHVTKQMAHPPVSPIDLDPHPTRTSTLQPYHTSSVAPEPVAQRTQTLQPHTDFATQPLLKQQQQPLFKQQQQQPPKRPPVALDTTPSVPLRTQTLQPGPTLQHLHTPTPEPVRTQTFQPQHQSQAQARRASAPFLDLAPTSQHSQLLAQQRQAVVGAKISNQEFNAKRRQSEAMPANSKNPHAIMEAFRAQQQFLLQQQQQQQQQQQHQQHQQPKEQQIHHHAIDIDPPRATAGRRGRRTRRRSEAASALNQQNSIGKQVVMLGQSGYNGVSRIGQMTSRHLAQTADTARKAIVAERSKMKNNAQVRKRHFEMQAEHADRMLRSNPTRENLKRADRLKTFVQKQVDERMEGHKPVFAVLVNVVQLVIMVLMIFTGELASWGMGVDSSNSTVTLLDGSKTVQTVQRPQNPYYGPQVENLVWWGSKWAACMRDDNTAKSYIRQSLQHDSYMGCCVLPSGRCGMTTNSTCDAYRFSSFYFSQPDDATYITAGGGAVEAKNGCSNVPSCTNEVLRPCCYGIYGQCAVITEDHCKAVGGKSHADKERCGQVNCLEDSCGIESSTSAIFSTVYPIQVYRFVTAMFLHVGVIHFVMNALGQYILVAQVEFVAGFQRTFAMYVLTGMCGFMISAVFSPNSLSNGASAAIYGMLGVETVDLFQTWQLLEDKTRQVIGLVLKLALFLGIGTLPYIDNFAHVGGFAAGIVAGLWLLPFIVFGKIDSCRKHFLKGLSAVFLLVLVVTLLANFFGKDQIECKNCDYINCVPYTKTMCAQAA